MTKNLQREVAVVGTAYSPLSRHATLSLGALAVDACSKAVADAGLRLEDIDGLATFPNPAYIGAGNVEGIDMVGAHYLARTLGLRGLRWVVSVDSGLVGAAVAEAVNAVAAGACNYALVWRAMHNPTGLYGVSTSAEAYGDAQFTAPYGLSNTVMSFALPYSRYLARYGATAEHMATFIVNNRANAARNPDAIFNKRLVTTDEYLSSRMIADPLRVLDCDMPIDGCGALVVTTAERARDLHYRPAYVVGQAELGIDYSGTAVMALESFMEGARLLADRLWKDAGVGPGDVDQVNVYDGFSYLAYLWLEAFGFCGEGEAFEFIQGGRIEIGGECPLNTSGGSLGMGRLHGMPQIIEAVRQIQRTCGERQVDGVELSLAHTGGVLAGGTALLFGSQL